MLGVWREEALAAAAAEDARAADLHRQIDALTLLADEARQRAASMRRRAAELNTAMTTNQQVISGPSAEEKKMLFNKYADSLTAQQLERDKAEQQRHARTLREKLARDAQGLPRPQPLSDEQKRKLFEKYSQILPTAEELEKQRQLREKVRAFHTNKQSEVNGFVSMQLWAES